MTFSLLLGVVLSAAPALGFVQTSDWYEHASTPAHFQPLHLVDGDLRTAWCAASSDAQADALTFGFSAMRMVPVLQVKLRVVEDFSVSERGAGGFGSTGKG